MRPPLIEAPASAFLIMFVQIIMLFCLFLALLYNVTQLTLFALIVLAMGLVSKLWSHASLNHLKCKIDLNTTRIFPGWRLKIDIRAINSKLLPVLFKVDLFAPGAIAGSTTGQWISEETGLLWYQQTVFSKQFFPNKRGVYNLGPPILRGADLFGFHYIVGTFSSICIAPTLLVVWEKGEWGKLVRWLPLPRAKAKEAR